MKINRFIFENRAQISAEMIILIAAIIAIVLLVVTQLQKTTKKANSKVDDQADKVFKQIDKVN